MQADNVQNVNILLIEDNASHREHLAQYLRFHFSNIVEAGDGIIGLELYKSSRIDIVVSDICMPGLNGIETARKIKEINNKTPIILVTAFIENNYLFEAVNLGIEGFVTKPVDGEILVSKIKKCMLPFVQQKEIENLRNEVSKSLESHFGRSQAMSEVRRIIGKVAESDFSVLLQGETGVGKTFIARTIHKLSKRKNKPFIQVDLGTLPDALIESELFGARKGAFTGADVNRPGRFELADEGTIFLDELENLSPAMQSKLLTVVEQKSFTPLGAKAHTDVNVRIISAIKGSVQKELELGKLREDLFFRLSEFEIFLPPLRERREDIPFFARMFAAEVADELGKPFSGFSEMTEEYISSRDWPGNMRELRNVIRRAVLLEDSDILTQNSLQIAEKRTGIPNAKNLETPPNRLPAIPLDELEKLAFIQALEESKNMKTTAAKMLGLDYSTFIRRLKKFGLN